MSYQTTFSTKKEKGTTQRTLSNEPYETIPYAGQHHLG
jgi:hypothetical protein